MSNYYNAIDPVVVEFEAILPNTKPKISEKVSDEDIEILFDLLDRNGEAAIVEGIAGTLFAVTSLAQGVAEILGDPQGRIAEATSRSERAALVLYAAAQTVNAIHVGREKSGIELIVLDERF